MSHLLRMDVRHGYLVAFCACGAWSEKRVIGVEKRPSELGAELEQAFQRHVDECEVPPPIILGRKLE